MTTYRQDRAIREARAKRKCGFVCYYGVGLGLLLCLIADMGITWGALLTILSVLAPITILGGFIGFILNTMWTDDLPSGYPNHEE